MLDFKVEGKGEKRVLTVNGELNIESAAALQGILMNELKESSDLVVNLDNVSEVDLSCLQLLCSANKTAERAGGRFSLGDKCPSIFREAAGRAGYVHQSGCGLDCDINCIWTTDDNHK